MFGGYPEGICYAILLANTMVPGAQPVVPAAPARRRIAVVSERDAVMSRRSARRELVRIALSMTRGLRGRRGRAGRRLRRHRALPPRPPARPTERAARPDLLGLGAADRVLVVRQEFCAGRAPRCIYRATPLERAAATTHLVLHARRRAGRARARAVPVAGAPAAAGERPRPLGRLFVGLRDGRPFAASWSRARRRGYKTPIRFFVALDASLRRCAGVRVIEHDRGSRARRRDRDSRGSAGSTSAATADGARRRST